MTVLEAMIHQSQAEYINHLSYRHNTFMTAFRMIAFEALEEMKAPYIRQYVESDWNRY